MAAGRSPSEVVEFYLRYGPRIFGHPRRRVARQVLAAKYRAKPLAQALHTCSRFVPLESRVPLCIPSFDLRNDHVHCSGPRTRTG